MGTTQDLRGNTNMIKLEILGKPMGKQRPNFSVAKGFVETYTPHKTQNYENLVKYAYQSKYGDMAFKQHQQLYAHIVAYFGIPKVHYRFHKRTNTTELDKVGKEMKDGLVRPTKKPDTDNIAKICLDSLNGIAYPDDSQIVRLVVDKYYAEEPKVIIEIYSKEETLESC